MKPLSSVFLWYPLLCPVFDFVEELWMKIISSGAVYFAAQGGVSYETQLWMKYSCMQTTSVSNII